MMGRKRSLLPVIMLLMFVALGSLPVLAVTVSSSEGAPQWGVSGTNYRAALDKSGGLGSLQTAGGKEVLRANGDIGLCLTGPQGLLNLKVQSAGQNVLEARCAQAGLRYEFDETGFTCTADNTSTETVMLIMNLAPTFKAICGDGKQWLGCPVAGANWPQASFFMKDGTSLRLNGLLGFWTSLDGLQYAQCGLAPHSKTSYRITLDTASAAEMATIQKMLQPWREQKEMVLLSPRPWQVFQRQSRFEGAMLISGHIEQPCDALEYRLTGQSLRKALPGKWRPLALSDSKNVFQSWEAVPAGGWYRLELRAKKDGKVVLSKTVEKVGMGEVFVGAGQSNSTNFGQFPSKQTSGMVAATDGVTWQLADDPQPGAHDQSTWGSFWPAFGDAMYEKYKVPIGVAVTGHGGTSVEQWQPDGPLHRHMMERIGQLGRGGFRAVLWHQGEAEVMLKTPPQRYYEDLKNLIVASKYEAGWEFPWFVAMATYCNPKMASDAAVRAVQQRIWDDGVALPGPDTDTLTGDYRDYDGAGVHLSLKGLKAHGQMWAEKVSVYLDQELAKEQPARAKSWLSVKRWK